MNYYQYLQSDAWQEKRRRALEIADHACQVCESTERLEVHHRTYERLGHERMSDLTVLCHVCHSLFSKRMQKRPFFWLGFLGINVEAVIYD